MNVAAARLAGRRVGTADVPKAVYVLLGLFLVLEYTRIPSIVPVLGVLRLQMFLILLLVVAWWRYADRTDILHPIVKLVGAFAFLCALSIFYTPNTRAAFNMMVNIVLYLAGVILPLLAFVRTTERLKWFLTLFVLSCTFIAVWALTHGGTGPGGFITDENDCALVLNVALPFAIALYAWPGQTGRAKLLWAGCAALLILGSVATMSRGGFLGLVACFAALFWYSRSKMKVIGVVALIAAIGVPLAPMLLPDRYMDEVRSISDQSDGTRQNRIYFWKLGWMMYKSNPVLGVGAGNYPWTVADYERRLPPDELFRNRYSGGRPSHSLYFTLLPELGTAGVIVYGSLVYLVIRTGRRARIRPAPAARGASRGKRGSPSPAQAESPERQAVDITGRAIVSSTIAFLGTGAFISVLYYPSFWHLAGIAASLGVIQASLAKTSPAANARPATGVARA